MTAATPTTTPRLRQASVVSKVRGVDWGLVLIPLGLVAIGLAMIYSSTHGPNDDTSYLVRQGVFIAVGFTMSMIMPFIDYGQLRHILGLIVAVSASVLVLVLLIGQTRNGARSWFVIGPFSIQPAEFAKISLIVVLAAIFSGRNVNPDAPRLATALGYLGGLAVLVLLERETGSLFVYACIALGIFAVAGVSRQILFLMFVSGTIVIGLAFSTGLLDDFQQERLTSFINPDADPRGAAYHQRQSVTAIGSGGITGQGYLEGPQTQLQFIPEQHTDFIFAAVGEELGLIGSAAVLILEGLILVRILRAAQLSRDLFGSLICAGVFAMFLYQTTQNTGMAMRVMPITGIPLPFVSYGGSSLMTSFLALGLVQSVRTHRARGSLA